MLQLYYVKSHDVFGLKNVNVNNKDADSPSDAQLVALSLSDQEKYGLLMERYEKRLLIYIMRLFLLDHDSAQDVLQEVFLKVYLNLNGYNSLYSFNAWIYRIAHNEAVNFIKKHLKNAPVSLDAQDEEEVSLLRILDSGVDIPSRFEKSELVKKVRQIVNYLPLKYREILMLRYIDDLDYDEIGYILRKPGGTVATLLNRAKEQFKTLAIKHNLNT